MTEIVVRFGKSRSEEQCSFEVPDGFLATLEAGQGKTELMVCVGGVPIDLDRPAEESCRLLKSAQLQPDRAQAAQRLEMETVRRKDDFVEPFRLLQTTLFVLGDGL